MFFLLKEELLPFTDLAIETSQKQLQVAASNLVSS